MTPVLLAGPTASGKSAVALELAARRNAEIVSVDSMQVYRGLDIGTAKPSAAERESVHHHLVDVVDLDESFDAAKFIRAATRAVADAAAREHATIFCGGTGLYFKAWLSGLGEAPPTDEKIRTELEAEPTAKLLEELAATDPVTFEAIDRDNPRRVVRAVEVIRITGKPFSAQRAEWTKPAGENDPVVCLRRDPEDLKERINQRVDAMFTAGLVAETERLLQLGLADNRTAMQAIGYRQVVEHLRGERDLAETVALIKTRTWQFARRQSTWFRNQLAATWIDVPPDESAAVTARRIDEQLAAG